MVNYFEPLDISIEDLDKILLRKGLFIQIHFTSSLKGYDASSELENDDIDHKRSQKLHISSTIEKNESLKKRVREKSSMI